jgi:hypothetical protein
MNTKSVILGLLLGGWVILGGIPVRAIDLDSLFVVSVGGESAADTLRHLRSAVMSGRLTFNGQPGQFIEYLMPPDRVRLEISFEQVAITQGYDGQVAWQTDQNGRTAELSGFEKRELLKTLYFDGFQFLQPDRGGAAIAYLGELKKLGKTLHLVTFILFGTDTVQVTFDGETGRRLQMDSRVDNLRTEGELSGYTTVHGVLMPMVSRVEAPDVPLRMEFEIDSVAFDTPIDGRIFLMTSAADSGVRFPAGLDSLRVPFSFRSGHIYLPVTLNGRRKVWLILDSGASATMLHGPAIAGLDLPKVGTVPARGMGGFQDVIMVRIDSLEIGQLGLIGLIGGVMDQTGIGRDGPDGEPFGGVIGYDFLSRFPVLVNFADSSLTMYCPERFGAPAGGTELPFRLMMQVPTVAGEVAGCTGDFIVDLGNAYGLILHRQFVKRNQLNRKLEDVHETSALGGIGGAVEGRSGFAPSFRLGGLTIDSLRVMLPEGSDGLAGSTELAGNIGTQILREYRLLFDYQRRTITLFPLVSSSN